jgi:hypothetical protein
MGPGYWAGPQPISSPYKRRRLSPRRTAPALPVSHILRPFHRRLRRDRRRTSSSGNNAPPLPLPPLHLQVSGRKTLTLSLPPISAPRTKLETLAAAAAAAAPSASCRDFGVY